MKTRKTQRAIALTFLLLLIPSLAYAQSDLSSTQALVRNLVCLLFWIMPSVVVLLFAAGGLMLASGSAENRETGKKIITNAAAGAALTIAFVFLTSALLPDVGVGSCFGAIPLLENQPPIAEARAGYSEGVAEKRIEVTFGDVAYFSAELSRDFDGSVTDYAWDFGDGEYGSGVTAQHNYSSTGEYYARLIVRDNQGASSVMPSTVRVIVNPELFIDARIEVSGEERVRGNESLPFEYVVRSPRVNASFIGKAVYGTPCPGPSYYSYSWYVDGNLSSERVEFSFNSTQLPSGKHSVVLNATDCVGRTRTKTMTLYVAEPLNVTIKGVQSGGVEIYESNCSYSACNSSACSPAGNRTATDRYIGGREYVYNRTLSPAGSMFYLTFDGSLTYEITDDSVDVIYPSDCADCYPSGFISMVRQGDDYYILIGEDDFIGGLENVPGQTCKEVCTAFREDFIPSVSGILLCGADRIGDPVRHGTESEGYTEVLAESSGGRAHFIFADDMSQFLAGRWGYEGISVESGTAQISFPSLCMRENHTELEAEKCLLNFSGTVSGGVPPYKMTWVSGSDGLIGEYVLSGENESYDLITTPPLTPGLKKGIHDIYLYAEDSVGIKGNDTEEDVSIPWCCAQSSPCSTYWPGREGPIVNTGNEVSYSCDIYEVCRPELWEKAREAIACCKNNCSGQCHKYCEDAYNYSEDLMKPDGTLSEDGLKKCAGLYTVLAFGPAEKFMADYFWPEICCLGDAYCLNGCCPQDLGTCSCCWHAYTIEAQSLPCTGYVSQSSKGWRSDEAMNKNTCKFADLPAYASMEILNTGTCCDYTNSLTTTLRIVGYGQDEVYAATGPGHCYTLVKFPNSPKWNLIEVTGNWRTPYTPYGISGYPRFPYCAYFNCRNDAGTFPCPTEVWGC